MTDSRAHEPLYLGLTDVLQPLWTGNGDHVRPADDPRDELWRERSVELHGCAAITMVRKCLTWVPHARCEERDGLGIDS